MRVVDLTLPIESHMAGIPSPLYKANPTRCVVLGALSENHLAKIKAQGLETVPNPDVGHHMNSRLEIVGHVGTHVDAPIHSLEDTWTIDEIPLERVVKKGRVIPLTNTEPGGMVTAEAVLASGADFDNTVIPILHTGWTERTWGTDEFLDKMIFMHYSVSELMVERGVSAVALDFFPEVPFWCAKYPPGQKPGMNHRTLLGNKIIIIQMLTNISAVDSDDFLLVAVPLRLKGLDGSPARVVAVIQ